MNAINNKYWLGRPLQPAPWLLLLLLLAAWAWAFNHFNLCRPPYNAVFALALSTVWLCAWMAHLRWRQATPLHICAAALFDLGKLLLLLAAIAAIMHHWVAPLTCQNGDARTVALAYQRLQPLLAAPPKLGDNKPRPIGGAQYQLVTSSGEILVVGSAPVFYLLLTPPNPDTAQWRCQGFPQSLLPAPCRMPPNGYHVRAPTE